MPSSPALPEFIFNEIKPKLLSKEKILGFLSPSDSVLRSERANVWIILTNYSIVFCIYEEGTDSLVDTLELKDLQEIEYIQRKKNIHLEFIPFRKAGSPLKLTFNLNRQADIDKFCELLADYVTFRKETPKGMETYVESIFINHNQEPETQPVENQPQQEEPPKEVKQKMPKMTLEERKNKVAQQNLLLKEILTSSVKKSKETRVSILPPLKDDFKDSDYSSLSHTVTSLGKDKSSNLPAAISSGAIDVKTVDASQIYKASEKAINNNSDTAKANQYFINGMPALRKSAVKNKERTHITETNKNADYNHPVPVLYYDPAAAKPGQIPKYNENEPEILPELRKQPNDSKKNEKTEAKPLKEANKTVSDASIKQEILSDVKTVAKPVVQVQKEIIEQTEFKEETETTPTLQTNKTESSTKQEPAEIPIEPPKANNENKSENHEIIAVDNVNSINSTIEKKEQEYSAIISENLSKSEPNNNNAIKRDENGEIILMESGNAPIPVLVSAVVAAASAYVWYKLFKFVQKNF